MKRFPRLLALPVLSALSALASAEAPAPGSVLVFPVHDSRAALTIVSVTNTRLGAGGDVRATFRYVNATPSPDPLRPQHCSTLWRGEALTPGDTVSVLTSCHDLPGSAGFLVVSAHHPSAGYALAHDHLVGSALVVRPEGSVYAYQAYSFRAALPQGSSTDLDGDGQLDFDGSEYEPLPSVLFADSFLAVGGTRLSLLHLAPDLNGTVTVKLDVQNDNEFPLSLTVTFRCWFELPLTQLGNLFSQGYLANTPDDPSELDVNCDGIGELETGWFRVRPLFATEGAGEGVGGGQTLPPILGALTAGPHDAEGGRILWGSGATPASF